MIGSIPQIEVGDCYLPLIDWTLRDQFILFEGPRGTAKTRSILTAILARAIAIPRSRWLLLRSTRTRLSQSVLTTLEEQVFPAFGLGVPGGAGRENRMEYKLANGSTLIPMGMDDYQRTQSVECAGMYVAEGVEISTLEEVTSLAGALRQSVEVPVHQCIVDCNPGPPAHWLNQIAESVPSSYRQVRSYDDYLRLLEHARQPAPDGRWKRVITRHQDNPGYFDVARWEWTKLGQAYLTTLEHLTGHLRGRWLDGEWVAAEGVVYPEFDEEVHGIAPFVIPEGWPILTGYDPGFDHPCAWLWFTIAPNQCLYIIDEIVGSGIDLPQLAKMVKDRNDANRWVPRACYGDPQYINADKQEAKSVKTQMAGFGISLQDWPRTGGNMDAMVSEVRQRYINRAIKVFLTCRRTIEAKQSWRYKRTLAGEVSATDGDKYEQKHKDVNDVVRGIVATNPVFDAATRIRIITHR